MEQERIQIELLGPPRYTFQGNPIPIKRRAVRRLFVYLACQTKPVNRIEVSELFWPAEDEVTARKNLREAISLLRTELPLDNVILTQNDFLQLNPEKVSVDTARFEALSEKLRDNTELVNNGRLPEKIYTEMRDVLRLWRSQEFLDGVNLLDSTQFQYWVMQKREILFYWRQMMMEWLANHYIAIGNLNEALYWLSTAVLHDRQNSELNFLTLNCLKDLGYRSAALHYCDVIESIYREGDQVNVPKTLSDLVMRVRSEADIVTDKKQIAWDLFDQKEIDYYGRQDLIDKLSQCINRGGVFQLIGEPGAGKTRTLKELYTSLEISPIVGYCRCSKDEAKIAYHTFVEAIRSIANDKAWQELDLIYALALLQLFPEITKIRTDIHPEDIEKSIQLKHLIPEAFYKFIPLIVGEKKGLLLIDDAQWCDTETIQVLSFIFEKRKDKTEGACILVLRNDIENHEITDMFSGKKAFFYFERFILQPFSAEQTEFIYHAVTGKKCTKEIREWLHSGSGGNISYLLELISEIELSDLEIPQLLMQMQWPIGLQLRRMIEERLRIYSGLHAQILSILAVAREPVDPTSFMRLSMNEVSGLNAVMSDLVTAGLIVWKEDQAGVLRYDYVHGVIKQIVLENMNTKLRQTIEARYFAKKG
ncbi:MAG: AAA family ATPase [Anaerolineaceae bacterium]|nr:AAA family ATPase [Anaerolineaceae bacterium]